MATASINQQTDIGIGEQKKRREDRLIELGTVNLHNASLVADSIMKRYRHVRPSSFSSPETVQRFEKQMAGISALLGDNCSKEDLDKVQENFKKFTDDYSSRLDVDKSPTRAHQSIELNESARDVDVSGSKEMLMLTELGQTLETLEGRSAGTGREHFRPDALYARAETRAAELMRELAGGGLEELHLKLLEVYIERERLMVTRMAKDELYSHKPAQDVANDVRNYKIETLRIFEYGPGSAETSATAEVVRENTRNASPSRQEAEDVEFRVIPSKDAPKVRAPRAVRPRSRSHAGTNTAAFADHMSEYISKQGPWAMEALKSDPELEKALAWAVAHKMQLSDAQAAGIYKLIAVAWVKQSPPVVQNFIRDAGVDVTKVSSMADVDMLSKKLLLAYSKLYAPAQILAMGLTKRQREILNWDAEEASDAANFVDSKPLWNKLYRIFNRAAPTGAQTSAASASETAKASATPPWYLRQYIPDRRPGE